jgi:mannosylglycerate hydrolase
LINSDDELSENLSIKHATLEDYFAALDAVSYDLGELSGEMRGSAYTQVTPSCLSSRIYLKQANWQLSTELAAWAEALNVVAWYHGSKYPKDQLSLAWKYLLKNHPHDSICGCSIDRVHEDMETRFAELGDMIDTLVNGAMSFLWKAMSPAPAGKIALPVINVTNWSQTSPAKVLLNLPTHWQSKPLQVVNEAGEIVPEFNVSMIEDYRALPNASKLFPIFSGAFKLHQVEFLASDVPALGFKTWFIQPADESVETAAPATSDASLDNEFLHVTINQDGTISVLDKQSGKEWTNLLQFADAGDDGDEYDYAPPRENLVIVSKDGTASISPVEVSTLKQTCKMIISMAVPSCITKERARSAELKTLDVHVTLALYAREPFLRATIDVNNDVDDHRLQACFPTGLNVSISSAADHFMVMNRTIDLPKDDGWFQPAQGLYHTDGFVDLSDSTTGLAVFVKGLPEFEILKNMDTAIAITLFRSVGWLSRDGMPVARGHLGRPSGLNGPFIPTPGAQCKRAMQFELAVMPHAGTWQDTKLWKYMTGFQVPLKVMVHGVRNHFYEPPLAAPTIKHLDYLSEGMIGVTPDDLVLSALKKAETSNGIILRLFNPTATEVQGTITLSFEPSAVSIVNLNEEFIESIMYGEGRFEFSVKPSQIMTFLVSPKRTAA